jgi:hypothetical protein
MVTVAPWWSDSVVVQVVSLSDASTVTVLLSVAVPCSSKWTSLLRVSLLSLVQVTLTSNVVPWEAGPSSANPGTVS